MTMNLSKEGADFIKGFEALRLTGYMPTPNDKPTIGWGHTGKVDGKPVAVGDRITIDKAEELFLDDASPAEAAANKCNEERMVEGPSLLQPQFDALVSLIFNIGTGNFASSTLRKCLVASDEAGTRAQWKDWCHQAGKVLPGLVARRMAEWQMFSNMGTIS